MRICLIYDCLFPHTIGGAERWYRELAQVLAGRGHEVKYLTLRQWERGEGADFDDVQVLSAGPRMGLYVGGRRRILPPLVFGAGVLWHLLRHGGRYDVVHTASFPYFSVLAAAIARRVHGFRLVIDWHEVWTREYWREYLGRAGWIGWRVQRLCARVPHDAFCFSRLHAGRLRGEGHPGAVTVLEGEYAGPLDPREPLPAEPLVVFAGRHIPEKRPAAVVGAVEEARVRLPDLRAQIFGGGPEHEEVVRLIAERGLGRAIEAPGFVSAKRLDDALRRALCMLLPSRREGYGQVVVQAASCGTPSVVVREPDNAAVELVEEGENGFVAPSADPEAIADAIVRVHEAGPELRERTAAWFRRNARRLSLESSLERVAESYRGR